MAGSNDLTALEEIQRFYKKVNDVAIPMMERIKPKDETKEAKKQADLETAKKMFNDDIDEEESWVDVIASEEMPNVSYQHQKYPIIRLTTAQQENNQEAYRLATGTGPIHVASAVLQRKISGVAAVVAEKASQAPAVVRIWAENQGERLAEGLGRVTVSDAVEGVLQRYPVLDRWRRAFFRGRDRGSQALIAPSPPPELPSSSPELAQLPETRFGVANDAMEDVPLGEDKTEEMEDLEVLQ